MHVYGSGESNLPPHRVDAHVGHNLRIMRVPHNPREHAHHPQQMEPNIVNWYASVIRITTAQPTSRTYKQE